MGMGTNIDSILDIDDTAPVTEELKQEGCRYSIRVYPSQEFEDSHYTNTPWVYAVVLLALFFLTSFVFLMYDWVVQLRQKKVMKSAMASGAIVSSLFPEQVRNQLYQENEEKKAAASWANTTAAAAAGPITGKPNAHLYDGTTIFFADLAGGFERTCLRLTWSSPDRTCC